MGFSVVGAYIEAEPVAALRSRRAPVSEPGLQDLLARLPEPVEATTDLATAALETDVTFVVVPTPTRSDGMFSETMITAAVREIGAGIEKSRPAISS